MEEAAESESVAGTGIARLTRPASDSVSDISDATGIACLTTIEASDSVSDPGLLWELSCSTGIAFLIMAGDPELPWTWWTGTALLTTAGEPTSDSE